MMFEVYQVLGNYEMPTKIYFDNRNDAQEYCLACAQEAQYERYCLEGYKGITWAGTNSLLTMGSYYVREVK